MNVVVEALILILMLSQEPAANPAENPPPASAKSATNAGTDEGLADIPTVVKLRAMAEKPYRIRVWLQLAEHSRLGPALRAAIEQEFQSAALRYFGNAWLLEFTKPQVKLSESPTAALEELPTAKDLNLRAVEVDKVFWIQVDVDDEQPGTPSFVISVREYDEEFGSWGPVVQRQLPATEALPTAVFRLAYRQFRANIGVVGLEAERKKVRVVVRGNLLQSAGSPYPLLPLGTPIKITRDIYRRSKLVGRAEIPWTYLIYRTEEADRKSGVCNVMSSLLTPVDSGMLRRSRVMGIAASTAETASTEVLFSLVQPAGKTGPDAALKRPAIGYEVLLRVQDQTTPVAVGNTDRRGKIVLPAKLASSAGETLPRVCEITLRIGKIPVATFPLVPGDEPRREVPVNPDPLLPEVTGRINALQDQVVDTMARQAILVKRFEALKSALEKSTKDDSTAGENLRAELLSKAKTVGDELKKLPDNKYFLEKLEVIRAQMQKRNSEENRSKRFSKQIDRLFSALEKVLKDRKIGLEVNIGKEETVDPNKPAEKEPAKSDPPTAGENK